MSDFWMTSATFRQTYGSGRVLFDTFSSAHFLWLGIAAAAIALAMVLFRYLGEKGRRRMFVVVTVLMLADELLKYVATAVTGQFEVQFLPFHLCSVNLFVALFNTIKPNNVTKNILYALCLPGAIIALLVPTWTSLPQWNVMFLHSETVHMLLVLYPCMLLASGFKPDYKVLPWVALFLLGVCVPAVALNTIFDTNFLFLNGTVGNPVLELCKDVFGDVYQIGLVVLLVIVWFLMYLPWEIARVAKAKKLAGLAAK